MSNKSSEQVLDLSTPKRISSLNLDRLTEDQILSIPREEAYLSRLRVRELRKIARDECGSGTWITHASKDELIEGTLEGRPPLSAQAVDRKGEANGKAPTDSEVREGLSGTVSQEYAQPIAQSMLDLLTRVSRRVVESEMKHVRSELNDIRENVGMDPVEESADPKDKITEVLKEEAQKSQEAAEKLNQEVEATAE